MKKQVRHKPITNEEKLQWLNSADSSYISSRILYRYGNSNLFRDIYYIFQQAVEKYFKSYLVSLANPHKLINIPKWEPITEQEKTMYEILQHIDNLDPANLPLVHDLIVLLTACNSLQRCFYSITNNPLYMKFLIELNNYDQWRYPEDTKLKATPYCKEISIKELHLLDSTVAIIREQIWVQDKEKSLINRIIDKSNKNNTEIDKLRDILVWENKCLNDLIL